MAPHPSQFFSPKLAALLQVCTSLQQQVSAESCSICCKKRTTELQHRAHLYSAARPSHRASAHSLVFFFYFTKCWCFELSVHARHVSLCIYLFTYLFLHLFLSLFFSLCFPRLISEVVDWMSTILVHMVWPYSDFRMQVRNVLPAHTKTTSTISAYN